MKQVKYVIIVIHPNQEQSYVKRVSAGTGTGKLTTTKNKSEAKKYKNEDYAMYDLDLLAEYVLQGFSFYYDFA